MAESDTTLRRRVAGVTLIVAPLLPLAAHVIQPAHAQDTASELANQAANNGRYTASTLLGLAFAFLAVPALFGLAHPLRATRPRLANGALALALAGAIATAVFLGTGLVGLAMTDGAVGLDAAAKVQDGYEGTVAFGVLLGLMIIGTSFAPLALLIGLWRAGWSRLLPIAGGASLLLFVADAGKWPLAAGFALTAIAWGAVGVRTMQMSDLEWMSSAPSAAGPPGLVGGLPGRHAVASG
ncbi:MAG TPA: hypothetical protein VNA12_07505 [Mycobacteriales bacterium]|nr:hypothetical protein [Mycobacteriales bacterium]